MIYIMHISKKLGLLRDTVRWDAGLTNLLTASRFDSCDSEIRKQLRISHNVIEFQTPYKAHVVHICAEKFKLFGMSLEYPNANEYCGSYRPMLLENGSG